MKESTFWEDIDSAREAYNEERRNAIEENKKFEGWHTRLILRDGLVLETNEPYDIEQASETDECGVYMWAPRIILNGVELPAGTVSFEVADVIAIIT